MLTGYAHVWWSSLLRGQPTTSKGCWHGHHPLTLGLTGSHIPSQKRRRGTGHYLVVFLTTWSAHHFKRVLARSSPPHPRSSLLAPFLGAVARPVGPHPPPDLGCLASERKSTSLLPRLERGEPRSHFLTVFILFSFITPSSYHLISLCTLLPDYYYSCHRALGN